MKDTIKRLTAGATRLLVLALGLGLMSTAWAEYVAGWDLSAIWQETLVSSEQTISSSPITCTTPSGAIDFTMAVRMTVPAELTGAATLASWEMPLISNNAVKPGEIFLLKEATSEGVARIKLGWSYTNGDNFTTYSDVGNYYDWTVDNNPHDWTIVYEDSSGGTTVYLDGVQKAAVGGLRFSGYEPTIRIGGATGTKVATDYPVASGLVIAAAKYRQGNTLPTTLSSNGYTLNINSNMITVDGVVVKTGGLSVDFASGDAFYSSKKITAVVEVSNVPSSGTVIDYLQGTTSSGRHVGLSIKDATTLAQSWGGSGNVSSWNQGYNDVAYATPQAKHAVAFAYGADSDPSGAQTFVDGVLTGANYAGLKTSDWNLRNLYIGSLNASSAVATGMKVHSIKLYSAKLADDAAATTAAADVILTDGCTAELGTGNTALWCGSGFYKGFTLDLKGQAIDLGTYPGAAGTITINDTTGGGSAALDCGTVRPTIGGLAVGATLAFTHVGTVSQQIEGYTATIELPVTGTLSGAVTINGVTADVSVADGTATLTSTLSANPTYTGESWWWDYEFNGTVTSIGSDKGGMTQEGSGTSFYNNSELYFQKTPYRDASFSDKSELTAVMYCQPGNYANAVLVGFGSTTQGDQKAIALVTGANPSAGEMKLVLTDGHNGGTGTVTELADLTAVGATTTKHLYAFVMDCITENETTKTRIRVYLDGKVKAIYKHNGTLTLSNGFQIGSLHGGVYPRDGFNTGLSKYSATGDSGTLDFLRVVDGTLTDGAMSALAGAYPYNSAYGKATRAPVSSAANWVATDVWTQTVPGQADAPQDAPNQDTNVTLSKGGSSDVSVAINLQSDSNYESLTLTKEAGATGSLKLTSGVGNSTSGKLVTAETSVLVDTAVPAGRVHLGVTSIADGTTLTVDPVTTVISDAMSSLGFGEVYEDVVISMALLGNGASVELDSTGVSTLAGYGFTAELVYNSSNMSYTFRLTREEATAGIEVSIASNGTATWATRSIAVPAPASLPSTYAGTVTITSAAENPVTIATAFAGGNVTVASGGPVTLSGAITTSGTVALNTATTLSGNTVSCALTGSGAVTINDTVTIADGGSIANTINGSGTIDCSGRSSKPDAFTFGTWTGTVVLPELASIAGDTFSFNNYGIEGSTVRVNGIGGGWLKNEEVNPTIDIPVDKTLTISDFSASFNNTFKALSGAGTFAVTYNTAIDTTSGSWYSNYSAYFLIKNASNFTGSLTTATPGIAIGASKPAYTTTGGKIILTTSATIAAGKTWTATEGIVLADAAATLTNTDGALDPAPTTTVANSYVKLTESTYSVDAYNTVTFTVANATYTRTDALGNAIKDGDTITFTVTPDANYGVSSVTATSGEVTNDDGTYSYVVTSDATITIGIVRTHVQLTIPDVEHATAAVTVGGEAAAGSSPYTVPYQSNVTVTWTPASGYKITAGATQTINSIAADTTAGSPIVEAKGATVSGVTFNYGNNFATATVTATVSGDATTYTLTVDGANYEGEVSGSTVTFSDVVTGHASAYDNVSYAISATDGTSSVVVSGGSGSELVATTTGWINENASTHVGGSWTNSAAVIYTDGAATITDNRFAADSPSTTSCVKMEFSVCFTATSDENVSGEAQGAIKLCEVDSEVTFMVLAPGSSWTPVANDALTPDPTATNKVVMTFDYANNTYSVDVDGHSLTNSSGIANFPLAATRTGVQNIDFAGTGTLVSMKGDQLEGYMVKDNAGGWYATIQAATQTYNSANGPYTVLHDGTAPSGWKIEGSTLIKAAVGMFFFAF